MIIRVVAVDDEPLALRGIVHLLRDMDDVVLVGTANGCESARGVVRSAKPDVVLLDIRMRDGSGLELAEELVADVGPAVVFLSAYDRYAARAFELAAADYVLKPAEPERLRQAIERARDRISERRGSERIAELKAIIHALRDQDAASEPARATLPQGPELWVRRNQREFVRLAPDRIDSIEAEGDYVRIHVGEWSYLHRSSVNAMEKQFTGLDFVRIHRASLVRFDAIEKVRRTTLGSLEAVLTGGRCLKAGRVHARALKDRMSSDHWQHAV